MRNGFFWATQARDFWLEEVAVLRESVFVRVLPAFEDVEEEADRVAQEKWMALGEQSGPSENPGDLAEVAREAGISFYLTRMAARQGLVNLFCVALHHLLEQQLLFLLRRELLPKRLEYHSTYLTRQEVVDRLAEQGIRIDSFPEWVRIDELRLVANVAKHAEGSSAEELKARRPDLFTPPILKRELEAPLWGPKGRILNPMSGEDLWVSDQDLEAFFESVLAFWRRLAVAMEGAVWDDSEAV